MKDFLKATFTKPKLQRLFVSTALGNFAAYIAGSLVMVLSTYHVVERRALKNLFGILPRKQVVMHWLPEWLEWLLALIISFVVMEFVRYAINNEKYEALMPTPAREREGEENLPAPPESAGDVSSATARSLPPAPVPAARSPSALS